MKNNFVEAIARSLVQHAARRAPVSLSERLEEEWLADFAERKGPLARLRFAVGCCWATQVIAHEYLEPKVAAASASGGSVATSSYERPDYSFLSRRTVAVLGIIGLHGAIIYAFATGLVQKVVIFIEPPISVIPAQPREIPRPEVLPDPTIHRTVFTDPVPVPTRFEVDEPVPITNPVKDAPPIGPAPELPVPTAATVKRVMGGPGKGFPNTDDFYPAHEIRLGTTGTATVSVCTDEKGKLTSDPTLVQTSGSAGLDQGALKLARAGSGRYRATTEDGRAVGSCYPFRVTFSLRH